LLNTAALQNNSVLFAQPGFGHHVHQVTHASSNKQKPAQVMEIFLQPGEHYVGDHETRIRTVLGSCVSMTFWHPKKLVGGMCHYMLPTRSAERRTAGSAVVDGRYADEAIALVMQEIAATGVLPHEFEVKMFGGGNMFPGLRKENQHVGFKNVEMARNLVKKHGFNCVAEHLGGDGHRNVLFDVWSGNVWVRQREVVAPAAMAGIKGNAERRIS